MSLHAIDPQPAPAGGESGPAGGALGAVADLHRRARLENFPVASRLVDSAARQHLMALYGYARLVDEAGDAGFGDRDRLLDGIAAQVATLFAGGTPEDPVIAALAPTVAAANLPAEPFHALIEANRRDQSVVRYEFFDDLLGYCDLSANPVGELVLRLFGALSPETKAWSDRICTGLQLVEHWQDIAEDMEAGRVYLPQEDLRRFGVFEFELAGHEASEPFRRMMAFEVARSRGMLEEGLPLIAALTGEARLAVAAYLAGGLAALDALEAAGYDVLAARPRASVPQRAAETLRVLSRAQNPTPATAGRVMAPPTEPVAAAYSRCLEIARTEARNFFFGIRLLPADRRQALAAVYALARRIDDIGDSTLPAGEKLARLQAVRGQVDALAAGAEPPGDDPVLCALADAATRLPIPLPAFGELIDGVETDVVPTAFESYADLLVYCRRVAGSVGRLSLGTFDTDDRPRAEILADDLGIALQLTNILRDVAEDLATGR
ncbi:MAG TPA: squalene synthase HpnC, partial [Actinomycetota bacterium]|nr:squalene synthase HpnC [Actinomycetota bacterium]